MEAAVEAADLGVGIIGAGWMGHVHARAYARLPHHYPELGVRPRLVAVADPVPGQLDDFAARFGPVRRYDAWRALLADPEVRAVSVTAPNALHREIGTAVAEAGRDLWIEKPVGLTAGDARAVADAVARAGVRAAVGFNYRTFPAVARARALLREGAIGTPTHARCQLLTDYAAHPMAPLNWRFTREHGGSGVLGDLASHGVDLVRFLLGDLAAVVAETAVFTPRRPLPSAADTSHYAVAAADAATGPVENADYVCALLRTAAGVPVTFEASRAAVGEQNAYGFSVHGTRGLLAWDFRRPGELAVSRGDSYLNQPVTRWTAAPGDGDYGRFHPGAGNAMSYDDSKVAEAADFLSPDRSPATPADAVAAAETLEALTTSAASGAWVAL
ncbi:Gfo/Idh/MocA family protein [Streptomyces millisiae]|uniref:Gfo/Idh/MocA family oxidoreductase n=1 Tax=Streptomyces millisiae TaxID=3075542 RepID=A0ABU2LU67_9ACTN|nr:Gfo/Idh/MocA family oxidoreductase [Streptomyces sp. DSM 44918]MDT0321145.1 Gfo/Idh/MocA family oxidoreductase [Streptomyces sp. DSM 44918]